MSVDWPAGLPPPQGLRWEYAVIVSHKYRFIFLHSRKTAGSAVTLSLLRYLDPDDWWLNAPAHGIMNNALVSGFVPPPVTHPSVLAAMEERSGAEFVRKVTTRPGRLNKEERLAVAQTYNSLQEPYPKPGGWQHVSAARARSSVGADVWNAYVKFSFERNPWDRMASLYWWRVRGDQGSRPVPSFKEFLRAMHSGNPQQMPANLAANHSNWEYMLSINGVAVDHLGRYENLAADLQHVMEKTGVPFDGSLPRSKHRTRGSGLEELYDDETVRLVGEIFHREIALIGYRSPIE